MRKEEFEALGIEKSLAEKAAEASKGTGRLCIKEIRCRTAEMHTVRIYGK